MEAAQLRGERLPRNGGFVVVQQRLPLAGGGQFHQPLPVDAVGAGYVGMSVPEAD